jgi:hypothetical protein
MVVTINKAVNTRLSALIAILSYDNVVKSEPVDLCPSGGVPSIHCFPRLVGHGEERHVEAQQHHECGGPANTAAAPR